MSRDVVIDVNLAGGAPLSAAEVAVLATAVETLQEVAAAIGVHCGAKVAREALFSVFLATALHETGVAATARVLKEAAANLPRVAIALRANQPPKGSA